MNNSNFRHSDEVEANFVVSEKEYLGSITLKEKASPALPYLGANKVNRRRLSGEQLWM
jgi:hypothetical protein